MKRVLITLVCAVAVLSCAYAESKIDLLSMARLRDARISFSKVKSEGSVAGMPRICAPSASGSVRALVTLREGFSASCLECEGVEVSALRGGVALCVMPLDEVERIAALDFVASLTVDSPRRLMTRTARDAANVDAIHQGNGLPQPYTGKNVICGIYDQGVDPNHVNFKDAEGNSRIFYLSHLRLNSAEKPVFSYYDNTNLHLFTTDEPATYHGAHTLGIMAGGYSGALDAGYPAGMAEGSPNPYYGMAPEADLMVTCGLTSDYFIAKGVDEIVNYAVEHDRPAVINLSLGGNLGSHDGNSAMGRFLEDAGSKCIIVMAAGNDGDVPLHASKSFSDGDTEFKTLIKPFYEPDLNGNLRYGAVTIYGGDSSVMDVQAVVLNRKTGRIAYRIPLSSPGDGRATYHITDVAYAVSDEDVVSQPLSRYFEGYIGLGSMIDPETGKFYCMVDYYLTDNQEHNADDSYVPGFIVIGKPGQTARIWCDGLYTCLDSYGFEGWADGSTDGTLSDLAAARNVVVVGSYNTDGTLHYMDGSSAPFEPSLGEFRPGEVTSFSAYGTLEDGRSLPHVCAPGVSLISSTSRFYVEDEQNGIHVSDLSAKVEAEGVSHWWSQTGGTSMAAPVVSGSIALWLEADPTLTVEDVIDIIKSTAVADDDVLSSGQPVKWGAGKFDAYAGLQEVIRRSGVNSVHGEGSSLLLSSLGDRLYKASLPGAGSLCINVYAADGRLVKAISASGDSVAFDLSQLSRGVYIVTANSVASSRILLK